MASIKRKDILDCVKFMEKENIFDKINEIYSSVPSGKCSGCGSCCKESVGISLVEFINIFNFFENNQDIKIKAFDKIIDYYFYEYVKKLSCPFKNEDNSCMIYEVRPLNCRIYGHWIKDDYNRNLENIIKRNNEYKNLIKEKYDFFISDDVVNFRIDYCEKFVPNNDYLTKSERLDFSDKIICLDSKLFANEIIDIDFKDRGIVEYFIEYLLDENLAYDIKIKVSKNKDVRDKAVKRLKKILFTKFNIKS